MAEQWIDATAARSLVAEVNPQSSRANEALCKRAYAGLIRARARLLMLGPRHLEITDVPARFWWAEGQAALEQNWTTGDFSTWIARKEHWRAFGVTFALSGLLEMLPADRRALTARRLSVAGNSAWMPAREASGQILQRPGVVDARQLLLSQARLGLAAARAVVAQRLEYRGAPNPVWEEREWDVPQWFWEISPRLRVIHENWNLGQFENEVPKEHGSGWMVLSEVHFLAESLLPPATELASPNGASPAEAENRETPGGRPPAAWWDDMWCDICGLVYEGKLIPNTQADVEKAMHAWAQDHGHSPAESTIRPKARKLFKVLTKEGENPPAS